MCSSDLAAVGELRAALDPLVGDGTRAAEIERVVPRGQLAAALAAVLELAPPHDEEADEAWRAELVKRHQTIRPFLPVRSERWAWC